MWLAVTSKMERVSYTLGSSGVVLRSFLSSISKKTFPTWFKCAGLEMFNILDYVSWAGSKMGNLTSSGSDGERKKEVQ